MGPSIIVVFEDGSLSSRPQDAVVKDAILDELVQLDEFADEFGLERLSSFGDNRPIPEEFAGDPEELSRRLGPFQGWFDCESGRRAVRGLLDTVTGNRRLAGRFDNWIDLEIALVELERTLARGAAAKTRFRLELED